MSKLFLVFSVMFGILFSAGLSAKESSSSKLRLSKNIKQKVKSSQMARADKKLSLLFQPVGFDYGAYSYGFMADLFITPNLQLVFANYQLHGDFSILQSDNEYDFYQNGSNFSYRGQAYELGAKVFVTNSFYVSPYLYSRSLETLKYRGGSMLAGEETDRGLGLKLGNQWHWDRFTLGCSWISYSTALVSENVYGESSSGESNLGLTEFYFGLAF